MRDDLVRGAVRSSARQGNVEGGGDGAEEFGFGDQRLAIGADQVRSGSHGALADGEAGGGEFVERPVERGPVAGGGRE